MVILGSTGSIGTNTLGLCSKQNLEVEALSCASNISLLNEQIAKFRPKFVCIGDKNLKKDVKHERIFVGEDGLLEMLTLTKSKKVVNSLVGFAGLKPSFLAQKLGKTLALANKESLVVGGKFLDTSKILAIDSEHFGLNFLLKKSPKIKKLIITASGGAFYKTPLKALKYATPSDALKHPNWQMGSKITIDSASMANKLFEVLEAYWLYGVSKIEAVIEPSSMIHALIEFIDGSTTAHICGTNMRLAIAHAVLDRVEEILPSVDLLSLKPLKFYPINLKKYPIFSIKDELLNSPDLGVIINAVNEVAVFAFLKNECAFLDISKAVLSAFKRFRDIKISNTDELFLADVEARNFAKKLLKL